ncbi:GHKL domain-containing protein [Euzebyella marina]|uniref:GHKL domain-containing protein n=1 Tax=Euzebyella marina TaxID=1761453 RepID=A0A3G2L3Y0_9FLAO|nr:histidine kinase [Euzebyella marina]AYN66921.1 GHKL domain-containing protein [Euzebyella marina]MAU72405.1 histidine kinase [Pseudozobellia sp.]MBG47172.1 histidine kinase [Pseudozobellia sp.]|tara:strand:- start:493 stop:1500 length:1008 start_codon:yes stop_codon:yes gene_type:complete
MQKTFISRGELLFQVILHILVLLFYSFDRNNPGISLDQILFFLIYTVASGVITYYLMPHYLYKKKYWTFFGYASLVFFLVIMIEELLETVIYPGTVRASIVPGIYYAFFDILPVLAILSGFKFAWDAIGSQQEVQKLRSYVQESELQFLKSQINPHFLFNNLNNLYSYALEGSAKTPEIILEMSGVLRYMLYECKEKFVPLQKELEQLSNFIKLYKLQIEERGKVNFIEGRIEPGYKIAPLILVVFIENAFKHSQSGQSKDIEIEIEVNMKDNCLTFICKNNFEQVIGLDTVAKGIGLKNVKKRLELLYPNKHELHIDETEKNFSVSLSMQLEKF